MRKKRACRFTPSHPPTPNPPYLFSSIILLPKFSIHSTLIQTAHDQNDPPQTTASLFSDTSQSPLARFVVVGNDRSPRCGRGCRPLPDVQGPEGYKRNTGR